jgi:SAM-dependent methyltransferase
MSSILLFVCLSVVPDRLMTDNTKPLKLDHLEEFEHLVMTNLVKRLWNMPPSLITRKFLRRINGDKSLDIEELLASPKHLRPQKFYDFLSRYETILARTNNWEPLDFEGKRVLEIGCGPLLGFGPLAIFRGAAEYSAIEPDFDGRVLADKRIVEGYLAGIHKDLSAVYGERSSMDSFVRDIEDKTVIVRKYLHEAEYESQFDIVISNSCLEHISPFEDSMHALRRVCASGSRFLHLVDFGSHQAGANPFQNIYSTDRENFVTKYGLHINLLRPTDVVKAMRDADFDASFTRCVQSSENYRGPVHEYWSSRYDEDELFTKTGIVFGNVS